MASCVVGACVAGSVACCHGVVEVHVLAWQVVNVVDDRVDLEHMEWCDPVLHAASIPQHPSARTRPTGRACLLSVVLLGFMLWPRLVMAPSPTALCVSIVLSVSSPIATHAVEEVEWGKMAYVARNMENIVHVAKEITRSFSCVILFAFAQSDLCLTCGPQDNTRVLILTTAHLVLA